MSIIWRLQLGSAAHLEGVEPQKATVRISIVTLSFNQRAFLPQALDSVLQQGYSDLEYIVVDPGSTDGSREVIQKNASKLAQIIFEPDRGAADGLNKGFAAASGEVFGFLNADDLLLPGALERVAEFFRLNPNCDLALGNGYIIDERGKPIRHVKACGFTVKRYLHGGSRWLQQATFFRREAFQRSPGFNVLNRTSWDGELFISMLNSGANAGYIDADLGEFRVHSTSISGSQTNSQKYREDWRRVFREIQGREWGHGDHLWHFLYKAEGLLIRSGVLRTNSTGRRQIVT
jgi:glycosyltransferase involved in cell wall biosynthesis